MKVWSEIQPAGGDYAFQPGERYAVLASVSENYSADEVKTYVEGKGFDVTYEWQQGDPSRATYAIDNWLAQLAPDTTGNHRWLYAEGNYGGASAWSVGQDPPWPFSMYHVAHVLEAVDAPDPTSPSDLPVQPVLPSSSSSAPATPPTGTPTALLVVGVALTFAIGLALDMTRHQPWLRWNL